ncbi:hypothetical protein H5410_015763, partial [Solanum commersonii]
VTIRIGGGEVSIINQLDKDINGKFSYRLISIPLDSPISNVTSHINFGSVSVGNKTLKFKSSKIGSSKFGSVGEEGNIIINSGIMLTFLPNNFYLTLESTLVNLISATKKDDPLGTFRLFYDSDNGTINIPTIVIHFTNAYLELSPSSTFSKIEECLVCLIIVPANEIAIFGNLAQGNFLIGYDLVANKISFKPTYCTKY